MYCVSYNKNIDFVNNFTVNKIIQSRMNLYSKKYSQNEIENIILEINQIDFLSKNTGVSIKDRMLCLISNICTGYYE